MLLLVVLVAAASVFSLDVILGAFAAVSAYITTALSIIVAVSSTAVDAGALTQAGASLMISGAAISVFLMPLLAQVFSEPKE